MSEAAEWAKMSEEVDHSTVRYGLWTPTSDPEHVKVLGKSMEESGEFTSALARCLIQGLYEKEPVTGKVNKTWLEEELADVSALMAHLMVRLKLDHDFICKRYEVKYKRLGEWFDDEPNKSLDTAPTPA